MIYLAGGVAEAIHLGERRQREIFSFLYKNCGIASDLEDAAPVLRDLREEHNDVYSIPQSN